MKLLDRRGASEVVGFVLAFSLITTTAGVVYVTGFSGLQNARDAQQFQNTERAFDVLADNLNDQHENGAPNRATEIKLADAALRVEGSVTYSFEITSGGVTANPSINVEPIVYSVESSNSEVVYTGGAVMRAGDGGASISDAPPVVTRTDGSTHTIVLPVVQTRARGNEEIAGSSTVLVRSELALREVLFSGTNPTQDPDTSDPGNEYEIRYEIETTARRAAAWERYLEGKISWDADACDTAAGDPGTVVCQFYAERAFFTVTRLDVNIDR